MISLAVVLGLFVCAQGFVLEGKQNGRVVGGSPVDISEVPYVAALLIDFFDVGTYSQACGGSIIYRDVILTGAQCTERTRASQWRVRVGSSLHNSGGQVIQVSRFTQHPSYNSVYDNDICLLFLSSQIVLGAGAATITLPAQGQVIQDGGVATIAGWGTLTEGGSAPVQVYRGNLPIVNQQQCVAAYSDFNTVTERMVCAGWMDAGGVGSCQGDTGGPLVVGGVLMGVTSWGNGCGRPYRPGVYTRVPSFRSWINSNT